MLVGEAARGRRRRGEGTVGTQTTVDISGSKRIERVKLREARVFSYVVIEAVVTFLL